MTLQEMLEDARIRELEMQSEYDRRLKEYEMKVLQNDEIRRNLKKEEDELKKLIPQEAFIARSEKIARKRLMVRMKCIMQ